MYRIAALLPLLAVAAAPAAAQIPCGPHDELTARLSESHAEVPVGQGLTETGLLFQVFASESGSWTVVATRPSKLSCVLAAGEVWMTVPPAKADKTSMRPVSAAPAPLP